MLARSTARQSIRFLQQAPRSAIISSIRFASSSSSDDNHNGRPSFGDSGVQAAGLTTLALLGGTAIIAAIAGRKAPLKLDSASPLSLHSTPSISTTIPESTKLASEPSSTLSPGSTVEVAASIESSEEEPANPSQSAAYNPVTGEINWACPCLGGMSDGPCGPEFKEAFSCFVYSQEEVKGVECVDRFRGMQECFRKYPEIYGDEIDEEEEETAELESQANAYLAISDEDFLAGHGTPTQSEIVEVA